MNRSVVKKGVRLWANIRTWDLGIERQYAVDNLIGSYPNVEKPQPKRI
jgi:hypothetical protein